VGADGEGIDAGDEVGDGGLAVERPLVVFIGDLDLALDLAVGPLQPDLALDGELVVEAIAGGDAGADQVDAGDCRWARR